MSTLTQNLTSTQGVNQSHSTSTAARFNRALYVELRKLWMTRATRWLLICVVTLWILIAVVASIVMIKNGAQDVSFSAFVAAMLGTVTMLVPVIAILVMASDWQSRDVMTLYALEPKRGLVFGAKLLTIGIVASVALAAALGVTAGFTSIVGMFLEGGVDWSDTGEAIRIMFLSGLGAAAFGAALGSAVLKPAVAIVWVFVQSLIDMAMSQLWDKAEYIMSLTWQSVLAGEKFTIAAATSFILWIIVPLAIGYWRNGNKEAA